MNKQTNIIKTNSFQINDKTSSALVEACTYILKGDKLKEESERAFETGKQFVKNTLVKKLGFKQSDAFEPKFKTRTAEGKLVTVENPQHFDITKLEIGNENCTANVEQALFIKDMMFKSMGEKVHAIYCMTGDERKSQLSNEDKGVFDYWNKQQTTVRKKLVGWLRTETAPVPNLTFEDNQVKQLGNMINKIKNRKDTTFANVDNVIKQLTMARETMKQRLSVPTNK